MKPSFALILSHEGIALLHRAGDGWRQIGEVDPADPDLGKQLRYLRQTATELSGGAFATKLVLPNSQILYRKIDALGATDARRLKAIRKALDGATPYPLDQLAIDWCDAGSGWAHVAVVAHVTLEEAEDFATEHKFNPVSYVAIPPADTFGREVFFGRTRYADQLIGRDEVVEADREIVTIVGLGGTAEAAAPEGTGTPEEAAAASTATDEDGAGAAVQAEAAATALPDAPNAAADGDGQTAPQTPEPATPEAGRTDPAHDARAEPSPEATDVTDEIDPAPRTPEPAEPGAETEADEPALEAEPVSLRGSAPPATVAFASTRRHGIAETPPDPLDLKWVAPRIAIDVGRKTDADDATEVAVGAREPAALPEGSVTAPRIVADRPVRRRTAKRTKKRGEAARLAKPVLVRRIPKAPPEPSQRQKEAEALTIFGARGKQSEPQAQTRIAPALYVALAAAVGLVAVAGSIVFDAPVTSAQFWRGLSGQPTAGETAAPMVAAAEFVEVDPLPEETAPEVGVELASLTVPEVTPEEIIFPGADAIAPGDSDLAIEPELPGDALSAEEILALTGIWSVAPEEPAVPQLDRVGGIYVASIDRAVVSNDAVAIAAVSRLAPDSPHDPVASPPPYGTTFELNPSGLVKATPEGAITPEGVIVYSGAPAIRPPLRPGSAAPLAAPSTLRAELAKLRPVARPEGLVSDHEKTRLGGRSMAEIAALRPIARPVSAQDNQSGQSTPADALVMASSVVPYSRPRNISTAVQRALVEAVASAPTASSEELESEPPVAAAKAPPVPTKANVAEQATIDNALRLSAINLIGVYGTANDRRALVRLRNGRYVKVQVGDALDGGRVASINATELLYVKSGRSVTLRMPTG